MDQQTMSKKHEVAVDDELDIRGLCQTLWRGKPWIIGMAILFAVIAMAVSYMMKQEWSATAITDKPSVNALGEYFPQQQFLRNLDQRVNTAVPSEPLSITDQAYNEFITQLASYDSRRQFWLQSDYYKSRLQGDAKADAVLLDELINDIVMTPRDDKKVMFDTVKLTAETSADANELLRQYVAFVNQRTSSYLNAATQGTWSARTQTLSAQIKRQEAVAQAMYQRQTQDLESALKIAEAQKIVQSQTSLPAEELAASDLFQLGQKSLDARLTALKSIGPKLDVDYDQNRAMLASLEKGPVTVKAFQTYRYLRTPEEPVSRDSPRRVFMMIMWGAIGALVGAGVTLARRTRS